MCIRDRYQRRVHGDKNVTITNKRDSRFFLFISKQALTNFETIELHALGLAMSTCVRTADLLQKYKYATLEKTVLESVEVTGMNGKIKKPKMRLVLTRSPNFKEIMEKNEDIRKENFEAFKELYGENSGGAKQFGYTPSMTCLLYTSPSPRDLSTSRMPSSA
eukprot:TRINITY_DN345_c0_g2_i5.p1 TRINITY_DN345_c0_g2~~TRINITY_DN345_c0_g2_i5.p1  ORF type:complete len:162 (+),score=39.39 TRINITY_DN345_c0_g2_i5:77-562(+)